MTWPSEGLAGLDSDGLAGNCHGGDYGGGHERKVEFAGFIDLQTQIFGFSALKARRIDVHGVGPDREQRDQIVSGTVRLGVSSQAGSLRGGDDGRSRDRRSGFIEDIAGETSRGLAMHGRRDHQRENADNCEK